MVGWLFFSLKCELDRVVLFSRREEEGKVQRSPSR
jgi:hypothetical protein